MSLRAHTVKPKEGSKKDADRVGRGESSGKGVYCGRGIKGQRARAGGKSGTLYIGMKDDIMRLPKLGGFTSPNPDTEVVNVNVIDTKFEDGDEITPWALKEKGLVSQPKNGVKILAKGEINVSVTVKDCDFSSKAKKKIKQAGGEIVSE
ncbi:MAG: 50S ribosomal protein L15 [Candidatus Magasanikbacteria bacterium]